MKKLLIIIGILILIGTASAWKIDGGMYSGQIGLYEGGSGMAYIEGYPPTGFYWDKTEIANHYEAHWMFYTIPFQYNPETDTITSNKFPTMRLIR